VRKLKIRM